jgi:hypothetical protein
MTCSMYTVIVAQAQSVNYYANYCISVNIDCSICAVHAVNCLHVLGTTTSAAYANEPHNATANYL